VRGTGNGTINPKHVFIFSLERRDRVIRAQLEKDIVLADVESDPSDQIRVFDKDGTLKARFPGIPSCEGLTYIPNGTHQGRMLIADTTASGAAVRSLDGSETMPLSISLGSGVFGLQSITWLKDRQKMVVISWSGMDWSIPTYLLSQGCNNKIIVYDMKSGGIRTNLRWRSSP
jgi:WD40 repeat protein